MSALNKKQLEKSYRKTMEDMQSELPLVSRIWSISMHAPIISHVATLLGSTLLRPRALVVGAIASITTTLAATLISHLHSYTPSGIEVLAGFSIGWLCGIVYDAFRYFLGKL